MIDSDDQAKLDKLARIEAGNRERAKRYLERVKKDGKKQLSAIISGEAYNQLCRIRDNAVQTGKPISFGQIIEKALAGYTASQKPETYANKTLNVNNNDKPGPGNEYKLAIPTRESQTEMFNKEPAPNHIPDEIPGRADKKAYKAWLFSKISGLKNAGMGWVEIKERLNSQGIVTVTGKAWGRGAADFFYKRNLERYEKSLTNS